MIAVPCLDGSLLGSFWGSWKVHDGLWTSFCFVWRLVVFGKAWIRCWWGASRSVPLLDRSTDFWKVPDSIGTSIAVVQLLIVLGLKDSKLDELIHFLYLWYFCYLIFILQVLSYLIIFFFSFWVHVYQFLFQYFFIIYFHHEFVIIFVNKILLLNCINNIYFLMLNIKWSGSVNNGLGIV